jgi:hypothetical protein
MPPTMLFTGANRSCKSTVAQAFRVAMTGQCFNLFNKRIKNEQLIGPWGKSSTVAFALLVNGEPMTLAARIKRTGIQCDLTRKHDAGDAPVFGNATGTEVRQQLWELIGCNPLVGELCINPIPFFFGNADLNSAMSGVLGDISWDAFWEYCGDYRKRVEHMLKENKIDEPTLTPALLKKLGGWMDDARRDLNSLIKSNRPEPVVTSADGSILTVADLKTVEEQVEGVQGSRDSLASLIAEMRRNRLEWEKTTDKHVEKEETTYANLVKEGSILRTTLEVLQGSTEEFEPTDVSDLEKRKREIDVKAGELMEAVDLVNIQVRHAKPEVKTSEDQVATLERDIRVAQQNEVNVKAGRCECANACPKCDGSQKPGIAKEAQERAVEETRKIVRAHGKQSSVLASLRDTLKEHETTIESHEVEINQLNIQMNEVGKEILETSNADKEREVESQAEVRTKQSGYEEHRVVTNIAAIAANFAAIRRDVTELMPKKATDPNEVLTAFDESLEKGRAKIADLVDLKAWDEEQEALKDTEPVLEFLNWGVTGFRDMEFARQCVEQGKEGFIARCNAALEPFEMTIDVNVDGKEVSIIQQRVGDKHWTPLESLSRAESTVVGALLAHEFNDGWLTIADDLDCCMGPWLDNMMQILRESEKSIWGIASSRLMETPEDFQPIADSMEDVGVAWFTDERGVVHQTWEN